MVRRSFLIQGYKVVIEIDKPPWKLYGNLVVLYPSRNFAVCGNVGDVG
jgi:hypothetical protein